MCLRSRGEQSFHKLIRCDLAGGFGYGLSIEKACNIGILPREFLGKTKVIGNSSHGGCVKYAERQDGDERIGRIKEISSEISLGNSEVLKNCISNI